MPRALAGDYAPRGRAHRKDVGIAVEFARRHGAAVPFAEAAHAAFAATVAAGLGEEDDAVIYERCRALAGLTG
jgi:3-hydroxyisobutyrate dehydrogenase-like beta-hydroxyacid dehydrogenase